MKFIFGALVGVFLTLSALNPVEAKSVLVKSVDTVNSLFVVSQKNISIPSHLSESAKKVSESMQ